MLRRQDTLVAVFHSANKYRCVHVNTQANMPQSDVHTYGYTEKKKKKWNMVFLQVQHRYQG